MQNRLSLPISTQTESRPFVIHAEWLTRLLWLLLLFAGAWLALLPFVVAPAPLPASAPITDFSAERALQDLAVVSAQPHPIGSTANAAVRDYLLAELQSLGVSPQVQTTPFTILSPAAGMAQTIAVENIMARLPGVGNGPALLVSGHYDSVPTTTGAADCGLCTVTVLEALRAIQAGPPLQNDIIFLFTDGEEVGIAGARAFMDQHPWAEDIGLSLVFEGLGTRGASILYATGPDSGALVDEAVTAASYPLAYSLINDLMWTLAGNSGSDLDAFVAEGQAGLAFVHFSLDGAPSYHTLADSIVNLDERTLQSHGTYAVDLLRHFGNLDLDALPRTPNAVYFNLWPRLVIHYPAALALPLALLVAVLYVGVIGFGLYRRQLAVGGLLAGVLALLLTLTVSVIVVTVAWWMLRRYDPNLHMVSLGGWYGAPLYTLGFVSLSMALAAAFHLLWRRRVSLLDLSLGGMLWWIVLALLTARSLIGFSYLFAWPALMALLALGWILLKPQTMNHPWRRGLLWAVPTLTAALLVTPLVYVLAVYMGRMEAMMGVPLAALPIPVVVLGIGLLLPVVEWMSPWRRAWLLPMGALILAVGLILAATLGSGFDVEHPKTNTVAYMADADTQTAHWLTVDDSRNGRGTHAQLDEWTQQFFPNGGEEILFNPWLNRWFTQLYPALRTPAPYVPIPTSDVIVVEDFAGSGVRTLRLRITAPAQGLNSQILLEMTKAPLGLAVNGIGVDLKADAPAKWQVNVYGRHSGGISLDLQLPIEARLALTTQDRIMGWPDLPDFTLQPRPAWMQPSPFSDFADSTIVRRQIEY